jgi:N-acetylmuramoyl-L-alanine amidase
MNANEKRRRRLLAAAVLLAFGALPAAALEHRVELAPGLRARLDVEGRLWLETQPRPGEGMLGLARRTTGSSGHAARVAEANGGRERLLTGSWYRVPFELLESGLRARVLRGVFPQDCDGDHGWVHRVTRGPSRPEASLWQVAEWFTGDGENFAALRAFNGMEDEVLRPDDRLVVPGHLVAGGLRGGAPACADTPAAGGELTWSADGGGEHAIYRLKAGEALYSSVVIRFTGVTTAADVNALAAEIAAANRIADVTDIPTGHRIRIPLDVLLPEYLPTDHPRRLAYERDLAATAGIENPVLAHDLGGITVILDAGHGGQDPGNTSGTVWESVYVYDIMLRVKEILETTTAATVVPTVRDGGSFQRHDRDVLPASRGHAVLTSPPYPIEDSVTGVHLRWYLANSVLARAMAGGDPKKTVFVSLHADSLHPSLRGAMAYVAAAPLSAGRYGKSGAVFASRREVRERPLVELSLAERRQSEGLSRELAEEVLAAFRRHGLGVYPDKPLRDKIVRHRRPPFVPAVLRYNAVPAKVLVEICNLNNPEDRARIQTRAFRQRVAEAVAEALVRYYGSAGAAPAAGVVAAAGR